jgi:hypothetical protein
MGEPTTILVVLGFVALAIGLGTLIVLYVRLNKKLRAFMTGKDGASLEATLAWLTQKVAAIDDTLEAHKEGLEHIDARVARSIRGYSLVKYNAYADGGGDQSFASGIIDEHGDGYILSVITNRNHVGVYAKRIVAGTAESSLTTEEKTALADAKKQLS